MQLHVITALSWPAGGIGSCNQLPWPFCRADMRHFKSLTQKAVVIMGRHTFASLHEQPLVGRMNIVVSATLATKDNDPVQDNLHFSASLNNAIEWCQQHGITEAWLIGGATLYTSALQADLINQCYVTIIHGDWPCDTYFPIAALETPAWHKQLLTIEECDVDLQCRIEYWRYVRRIDCCSAKAAETTCAGLLN